ncbi:MAG: NUDIX domain-containing protein [bacterium]|nr:NUDIX domain-containing protein [bacterium]
MIDEHLVRVGVGVFVFKDGEFIMLQRKGSHGSGSWSVPGGHLDFGESFKDTAVREVKEETGLDIKSIRFGAVTNDYFRDENMHYVTVWMVSHWAHGEEYIAEPDKCSAQAWHTLDDLPDPLFLPWNQLLGSEFVDRIKQFST